MHPRNRPVGLDVLHPAVRRVRDVDPAGHLPIVPGVAPALDRQALDAGPARRRGRSAWRSGRCSSPALKVKCSGVLSVSVPAPPSTRSDLDAVLDRSLVDPLEVLAVSLLHGRVVGLIDERDVPRREVAGGRADGDRRGFFSASAVSAYRGTVTRSCSAGPVRADGQHRPRRPSGTMVVPPLDAPCEPAPRSTTPLLSVDRRRRPCRSRPRALPPGPRDIPIARR